MRIWMLENVFDKEQVCKKCCLIIRSPGELWCKCVATNRLKLSVQLKVRSAADQLHLIRFNNGTDGGQVGSCNFAMHFQWTNG